MQDAIEAIEAAIRELEQAREAIPSEEAAELDEIVEQARMLLESLKSQAPAHD
jgi:hypothetical protein